MADFNWQAAAENAAQAVSDFRSGTNSHWNDSYLNMGAQLVQQQYENQMQLDLWNLMNEYNSPANQMARFKEAGLNPNLIYQQGTPGNANSTAGFSPANYKLTPHQDTLTRIQEAKTVIDTVTDFAQNLNSIMSGGMDVQMKKNALMESNFERALMRSVFPDYGDPYQTVFQPFDAEHLNPFSKSFDVNQFFAYQKLGQLPQFMNQFATGEHSRALTKFKADYQDYYNKNILPKFKEYQQGKVDLQEIEKEVEEYNKNVLTMMPEEIRGIVGPLVDWLSPFLKFIFKRGVFNGSKTVTLNR